MIFSNAFSKKPTSEKPVSDVQLIPILTADQLLTNLRSQSWLNKLKSYLNLPEAHFEVLYVELIEQFAAFVQIFPSTTEGKLGGLLSEGLARAITALKSIYESNPDKVVSDPRYTYAFFSAALLLNVGYVTNTKITLSDEKGLFIADWLPYQGSLVGKGDYYKMHRYAQVPPHLHHHTAALLARQIMPEVGFLWLAEDMRLFHMWLALLNGDQANAGSLEFILSIPLEEMEHALQADALLPIEDIEFLTPPETQEAENFLHWLRTEIEKGHLAINTADAGVFILPEGMFISMQLFKEFCSAYSAQHYTVVVKAFNHLGLTELSGGDYKFLQYFEKSLLNARQKADFKQEHKAVSSFLGQHADSLARTQKLEKEGVLIKEKDLILNHNIDPTFSASIVSPSTTLSQLPLLETAKVAAMTMKASHS